MNLFKSKIGLIGKAVLAIGVATALFAGSAKAGQQDDQIAIQLGALMLNVDISSTTLTNQNRVDCLAQGRAALKSTFKKNGAYLTTAYVSANYAGAVDTTTLAVQGTQMRDLVWQATQAALTNPVSKTLVGSATGLKPISIKAVLDPQKTVASAIFAYTMKRIPNYSPDLVKYSIAAALANSSGVYVYKYKDQLAALKDVNKIATAAMATGLKTYAKGTLNWAGVPVTGTMAGATYLPNFSLKPLAPKAGALAQPVNPQGLANAASAIAASATEALRNAIGTGTATQPAYMAIATALVKGAAKFQKTAVVGYPDAGAVGAAGFGMIAMNAKDGAGAVDLTWEGSAMDKILYAIVEGGIKGAKASAYYFAYGVTAGYAAAYLLQDDSAKDDKDAFKLANVNYISSIFVAFKIPATNAKLGLLADWIKTAVDDVYRAWEAGDADAWKQVAGAAGLQLPDVYRPVTDTVGL